MKKILNLDIVLDQAKKNDVSITELLILPYKAYILSKNDNQFVISERKKTGIYPINTKQSTFLCDYKSVSHSVLNNAGIKTAKYVLLYNDSNKKYSIQNKIQPLSQLHAHVKNDAISLPFVIKPDNGAAGMHVYFVTEHSQISEVIEHFSDVAKDRLICEQYIPGEEYRVFTIDGKVMHMYQKLGHTIEVINEGTLLEFIENQDVHGNTSSDILLANPELNKNSHLRTASPINILRPKNIATGGSIVGFTVDIPNEIQKVAMDIYKATDLRVNGIDIIINERGIFVLEINDSPGLGGEIQLDQQSHVDMIWKKLFSLIFKITG